MRIHQNLVILFVVLASAIGFFVGTFYQKQNAPTQKIIATPTPAATPSTVVAATCPECPCLVDAPLLPAPEWVPEMEKTLKTTDESFVQLRWKPVQGAKFYYVRFLDRTGRAVRRLRANKPAVDSYDHPLPHGVEWGYLNVVVTAVNAAGKESPYSKQVLLYAKARRNVTAPIIEDIKIEE